ncbi:unnamed protein product [Rotaria socialis]|uniref:Peptide hydrolase n=1 Tax=Rotaria socialis TaxID=392032 RepID=A0A820I4E0_9BILA|nr:unnamed protein product [Rotaria socialis]CAF3313934.1 unnamed protein product [Rotaria socialis]CAF4120004.1 unnamed protein product [Rotaria socialis]CAF4305179.1 unnamed protein product [Rotaria socialis]
MCSVVGSFVRILILFAIGVVLLIVSIALNAATLSTINKRFDEIKNANGQTTVSIGSTTRTTTQPPSSSGNLTDSIRIADLMYHLNELQRIANDASNTRAIGTRGFSETVNYIYNYLAVNAPNLNVVRQPFLVKNFTVKGNPILILSSGGSNRTFTYSTNLARSDFTYANYSAPIALTEFNLTVVPNYGCDPADWQNVAGQAALVVLGGICTFAEKCELANKYNASALLYYNHGLTTASLAPVIARLRQVNTLPAVCLSYAAGQELVRAANMTSASIWLQIEIENYPPFMIENVCANTKEGNINETIVIGGHSDSVPAGPGINDNGSGAMAILVLATNLARLYQSGNYIKYKYRVRFCWWAAEEIGLVGAIYHAQQAQNSSAIIGNRLQDYLINLNYDMLGSPNYMLGVYNGSSAKPGTPPSARNGSIRISETFSSWFDRNNLPWDYTDFSGRSDYGPFLAAGIVAGGLFSGADETKTPEQRARYEEKLGLGQGGLAGAILDPCYHKACDTTDNINQLGYEKMVQAAAYMLEYLGRLDDLPTWLYPNGRQTTELPENYFPNSDYFRDVDS